MRAYHDSFNNIEVPLAQVDMMVQKAINEGKVHLRIKRRISIGAAAVLLGICILSSGFVSPSMAKVFVKMPLVGSLFASFADKDLSNINSDDLTKFDDLQITDHGVTVAIKEVYYDQSNISIAYLVSGADYSDEKHFQAIYSGNGEHFGGGGSAVYNQISDKLYSGLEKFYPGVGSALPEKFDLEVVLTDDMEKSQKSPYRFTIPVSRSQADVKTKNLLVMKAVKSGNGILLVKKIVFTPVSTVVEYDYSHPDDHGKQLQGKHDVKLMNSQGTEMDGGSLSWQVTKNKDTFTNKGSANFSATNEPNGNWTFELVPVHGENIRVDFNV